MEERQDMQAGGLPFPGEWKTERDQLAEKTKVNWKGKTEESYPWGKETDFEEITYEVDDNHPESNSVQGEAAIVMALKDRTLTWRGHLSLTSDAKNFYYKYVREFDRDGKLLRQKTWDETVARDHQ